MIEERSPSGLSSDIGGFRGVPESLKSTYKALEEDLLTEEVMEAAAAYRPD